jgi:hypothetical protein
MPDRYILYDGYENAYGYRTTEEFEAAYYVIKNRAVEISESKQYRKKVGVAFPIFLDYQYRWEPNDYRTNYYSPSQLGRAIKNALEISDEFVWLYSEKAILPPFRGHNVDGGYIEALNNAKKKQ